MSFTKYLKMEMVLAIIVFLIGCSSAPKCSDVESIKLIENIFYGQFDVPIETKDVIKKYLKFSILSARSTAINENIKKTSCEGTLVINFVPEELISMVDKYVFLNPIEKLVVQVRPLTTFSLNDYQSEIQYYVQDTEIDGLYGSVAGIDKLVKNVEHLVRIGVFNNSKVNSFKKATETDNSIVYYDANSIVKKDDYVLVFSMVDYKQLEGEARSEVEITKFYCDTDDRYSIMNLQHYTKHSGGGDVVAREDKFSPIDIYALTSLTKQAFLWEVACNKRPVFRQPEMSLPATLPPASAQAIEESAPSSSTESLPPCRFRRA